MAPTPRGRSPQFWMVCIGMILLVAYIRLALMWLDSRDAVLYVAAIVSLLGGSTLSLSWVRDVLSV